MLDCYDCDHCNDRYGICEITGEPIEEVPCERFLLIEEEDD